MSANNPIIRIIENTTIPPSIPTKIFKVSPAPPKSVFGDIPVDVGPQYEGQRVRAPEMYVELGGPKVKHKFELFLIKTLEEIEDGEVIVVGPDLAELKEGESRPYAVIIEAAGKGLDPQAEGVFERRVHEFSNYIQGYMHLNQRYDIWLRVSKRSYQKGLNSFKFIGTVLYRLFKSAFPVIEKLRVIFVTDPKIVEELYPQALKVYEERDRRALGLKDEDVDMFYACKLCQSFAPTHACIITPERPSACGAISWLDARVAAQIDPKGPIQPVSKGRLIDPVAGEYEGVNEAIKKLSNGTIQRVRIYSLFDYPPTICGCFEIATYYIPELDAVGLVHRGYATATPIGLRFSQIADAVGGGKQVPGFQGIGLLYLRSKKLFQADGGWNRVVWMPSELKQKVLDAIPPELKDKIATEKDAQTIEELRRFLIEKGHPVAKKISEKEKAAEKKLEAKSEKVEKPAEVTPSAPPTAIPPIALPMVSAPQPQILSQVPASTSSQAVTIPLPGGITVSVTVPTHLTQPRGPPINIALKGVKVRIEKVVIKRGEVEKK
ncbi:MAG: CO dehydrogenase/CO-methylating acetyl-CoA synthase complex subunit beta [Ignisphaera sp.]|uniref:CO-methylating acetyl-CoA synthase n=1 Tax=Ignisphaera aggregans TaxID=334771 RepID=A0A7C4JKT9_9CREN